MPEKPERETVTVEQIALTNMYHLEAPTELLEEAGVVTKKKVLERIKKISNKK